MKGLTKIAIVAVAGVALTSALICEAYAQNEKVVVDDFESGSITNSLGGKTNVYVKAPSKAMMAFRQDHKEGRPTTALMLRFDKRNEGGPFDMGGWCGYYTLLKKIRTTSPTPGISEDEEMQRSYFDASAYRSITLWVKGIEGKTNFMIGAADAHWDKVGDSVKSEEIGIYLPAGKITDTWQKAIVPLDDFFIDTAKFASISVSFEADCFPEGAGEGIVYIDDIALE